MMQAQRHSILPPPPFPSHYADMPCVSGQSIGPVHKWSQRIHLRRG